MKQADIRQIIIDTIYDTMMRQDFEDWSDDEFTDHVLGRDDCKNQKGIKEDISNIFNIGRLSERITDG